ncbi:MAG TPA: DUF1015 domain-containing protein, partial [Tepidisphaeraceae bacterium]|nr:DUF1015 domain-containing protein [Tepidisphaeraceae bacterium]
IRPFTAIHYSRAKHGSDLSKVIAPPYDVLDQKQKDAFLAKDPHNIVAIDLPHMPPKSVGPDSAYAKSNTILQAWISAGVFERERRPAIYPYAQTYTHGGRTYHRRGFFAAVELSPFGQGQVVPHEKTYEGAIQDRLKLTHATSAQISPVFGLFPDRDNQVNNLLYKGLGQPHFTATLDGVKNDLWIVQDAEIENQVIDLMKAKAIYIADGHHRYTTALQYQTDAKKMTGGKLPADHPANYCLFALVSMQDPGLLILPTHRLIGGLTHFDVDTFKDAVAGNFEIVPADFNETQLDQFTHGLAAKERHTFGLFDGKSRKAYLLRLKNLDVLKTFEPDKSDAWRRLDVAILQRYLLDEIIQPRFAQGGELTKGYTADAATIAGSVDGQKYQIALLLKPTPLSALEELGRHNEVMPQKSTYFFPKLATGMVLNPLYPAAS